MNSILQKTITPLILLLFLFSPILTAEHICGYNIKGEITIKNGTKTVNTFKIGLAETQDKQQQGLMNCPFLNKNRGLFFIFPESHPRYFWMKNTYITLAIIYFDKNMKIVTIKKGEPLNTQNIPSKNASQYVLEINWNEAKGMKVGNRGVLKIY